MELINLESLVREISDRVSDPTSDAIWSCEDLLRESHSAGIFSSYLNEELKKICANPHHIPFSMLPLVRTPKFKLSIVSVGNSDLLRSTVLRDSPEDTLLYVMGPSPLRIEQFEQQNIAEHDVFNKEFRLVKRGNIEIKPGESFRVEAARTVLGFSDCIEDTVLISIHGPNKNAIMWEYDPVSLFPVRAISSSLASSRLEFALVILAELGASDLPHSIESALKMLSHPKFFVRWRAAHAINKLAPDQMGAVLESFLHDPHPHVRRAASDTLSSLRN